VLTPPFPAYPAAHTTFAGAGRPSRPRCSAIAPRPFSLTSATAGGVQHRVAGFAAVADEVENARVWGGVHFHSSSAVGRRIGDVALHRLPAT
jgi:hypothetical protein